ncbi:hypothetical protein BU24DRAFT_451231 [Aaosphaeria arxii CBS 175.79]|uniref:Uncharacterized protein n=1 Tax=Aaosphaeria arxii CBS 175.79 TaxID=1450172 RepID=A0A6A5XVN5_9PLEO|nr:uncharacterized protein BU24DRAFT_451231 [Aaosphaeria arxii CBS 175.79]KAF2016771.1 hypothetical protein BU24DRAFT_451231 [Aaosphaeria arxii CBS 175.79]
MSDKPSPVRDPSRPSRNPLRSGDLTRQPAYGQYQYESAPDLSSSDDEDLDDEDLDDDQTDHGELDKDLDNDVLDEEDLDDTEDVNNMYSMQTLIDALNEDTSRNTGAPPSGTSPVGGSAQSPADDHSDSFVGSTAYAPSEAPATFSTGSPDYDPSESSDSDSTESSDSDSTESSDSDSAESSDSVVAESSDSVSAESSDSVVAESSADARLGASAEVLAKDTVKDLAEAPTQSSAESSTVVSEASTEGLAGVPAVIPSGSHAESSTDLVAGAPSESSDGVPAEALSVCATVSVTISLTESDAAASDGPNEDPAEVHFESQSDASAELYGDAPAEAHVAIPFTSTKQYESLQKELALARYYTRYVVIVGSSHEARLTNNDFVVALAKQRLELTPCKPEHQVAQQKMKSAVNAEIQKFRAVYRQVWVKYYARERNERESAAKEVGPGRCDDKITEAAKDSVGGEDNAVLYDATLSILQRLIELYSSAKYDLVKVDTVSQIQQADAHIFCQAVEARTGLPVPRFNEPGRVQEARQQYRKLVEEYNESYTNVHDVLVKQSRTWAKAERLQEVEMEEIATRTVAYSSTENYALLQLKLKRIRDFRTGLSTTTIEEAGSIRELLQELKDEGKAIDAKMTKCHPDHQAAEWELSHQVLKMSNNLINEVMKSQECLYLEAEKEMEQTKQLQLACLRKLSNAEATLQAAPQGVEPKSMLPNVDPKATNNALERRVKHLIARCQEELRHAKDINAARAVFRRFDCERMALCDLMTPQHGRFPFPEMSCMDLKATYLEALEQIEERQLAQKTKVHQTVKIENKSHVIDWIKDQNEMAGQHEIKVYADQDVIEEMDIDGRKEIVEEEMGSQPIEERSVEEQQIEQSMEEQPVEEQPIDEEPVDEQLVEEQLVKEQPVDGQPVREQLIDEQPVEEQLVEGQLVEEQSVEEQSVEEQPVEEQPVEEQLIDEDPVNEQLVDEQPVDEEPVDEEPVDEEPVEYPIEQPMQGTNEEAKQPSMENTASPIADTAGSDASSPEAAVAESSTPESTEFLSDDGDAVARPPSPLPWRRQSLAFEEALREMETQSGDEVDEMPDVEVIDHQNPNHTMENGRARAWTRLWRR